MSTAREAKPSGGPEGTTPRDCREADTPAVTHRWPSKEADA